MGSKVETKEAKVKHYGSHEDGWALSAYRRFLADIEGQADDEGGDGVADLKPDSNEEYEQRLQRREAESEYGSHVREARDPSEVPDEDIQQGMGQGMMEHPLLGDLPLGTEAPMERINAMENSVAKLELQRKLENKLREEFTNSPTPSAY